MDLILAVLVLGAVIFFGALISAGNERQRKALDGIREQAALWAMQDLQLKRERLARDIKIDEPITWLGQVVAKVYGENLDLTLSEVFNDPQVLVCLSADGRKVMFSPASPNDIQQIKRKHQSKLSRAGIVHPLLNLPRKVQPVEISLLNAGLFFDQELDLAWKVLVGTEANKVAGRLWMYL